MRTHRILHLITSVILSGWLVCIFAQANVSVGKNQKGIMVYVPDEKSQTWDMGKEYLTVVIVKMYDAYAKECYADSSYAGRGGWMSDMGQTWWYEVGKDTTMMEKQLGFVYKERWEHRQPTFGQWISVKQLPSGNEGFFHCLVNRPYHKPQQARFNLFTGLFLDMDYQLIEDVTDYMPMPLPKP